MSQSIHYADAALKRNLLLRQAEELAVRKTRLKANRNRQRSTWIKKTFLVGLVSLLCGISMSLWWMHSKQTEPMVSKLPEAVTNHNLSTVSPADSRVQEPIPIIKTSNVKTTRNPPAQVGVPKPKEVALQVSQAPPQRVTTNSATATEATSTVKAKPETANSAFFEAALASPNPKRTEELSKATAAQMTNQGPKTERFKILEVPADGVVMIQEGKLVKAYKVGDKLPSGEILRRADAENHKVVTDQRELSVNK